MSLAYRFGYRVLLGLAPLSVLSLGFASLAQAQRVKVNERTRIPVAVSSRWSTEPVLIEGTSHVIVNVTQDQSGGSHAWFHSTLIGQGVGASGDRYIVQERTNAHGKSDLDSADNSTVVTYSTSFARARPPRRATSRCASPPTSPRTPAESQPRRCQTSRSSACKQKSSDQRGARAAVHNRGPGILLGIPSVRCARELRKRVSSPQFTPRLRPSLLHLSPRA
jgi:hypothetical protein